MHMTSFWKGALSLGLHFVRYTWNRANGTEDERTTQSNGSPLAYLNIVIHENNGTFKDEIE